MFKFIPVLALLAAAQAAPGLIAQTHSMVQPAVYAAPVVKTIASPVVHTYAAAPLVKTISTPVVHTYAAVPVVKTIASPVVHTYAAAAAPVLKSVVHSAPLVKTVPVAYTSLYH